MNCSFIIKKNSDFCSISLVEFSSENVSPSTFIFIFFEKKNYVSTTGGAARIDYVYLSSPLMEKVKGVVVVGDKWMTQSPSIYVPSFYDPSDHRPILIDLEL